MRKNYLWDNDTGSQTIVTENFDREKEKKNQFKGSHTG